MKRSMSLFHLTLRNISKGHIAQVAGIHNNLTRIFEPAASGNITRYPVTTNQRENIKPMAK